jgi:hypothetical protein
MGSCCGVFGHLGTIGFAISNPRSPLATQSLSSLVCRIMPRQLGLRPLGVSRKTLPLPGRHSRSLTLQPLVCLARAYSLVDQSQPRVPDWVVLRSFFSVCPGWSWLYFYLCLMQLGLPSLCQKKNKKTKVTCDITMISIS